MPVENLHTNAWIKLAPPGVWQDAVMAAHARVDHPKRTRLEMEAQDENVVISNKQMASKILWGVSVVKEEKSQVLFNSGGVRDADGIEAVLRVVFPKMYEIENGEQDKPYRPRIERAARNHSCSSQTQDKYAEPRSSLNKSSTFRALSSQSGKMNFWKALRKTTATVQAVKCVVPQSNSLLVGVPIRRRRISGRQEASRKRR